MSIRAMKRKINYSEIPGDGRKIGGEKLKVLIHVSGFFRKIYKIIKC